MSTFGAAQEVGEGFVKKIYTGLENFKVVSVNPDHAKLKEMFGENAKEPIYLTKSEIKDESGNVTGEVDQLKFDFYVDNQNEEQPITTKISLYVNRQEFKSYKTGKSQVINLYGRTTWLTEDQINQALPEYQLPKLAGGTYPYDGEGMRKAYKGEEAVIALLRAVLGLKAPKNNEDKKSSASQFDVQDWENFFKGNFKLIQQLIENSNNKIGILLGAKTVEENVYQDAYARTVVPQYIKNTRKLDYLRKQVENAKANGGFGSTDFGDPSYKLVEYNPEMSFNSGAKMNGGSAPEPAQFSPSSFSADAQNAFSPNK